MAINKVDFGGKTLIDLTADTVTAADLRQGVTAHDKAGNAIIGTYTPSGGGGAASAHGTISGYENGALAIPGLPFRPSLVILKFSATKKNKTSNFCSSIITDLPQNTISYTKFTPDTFSQTLNANIAAATAEVTSSSVTLPLIDVVDKALEVGPVEWWAFSGL